METTLETCRQVYNSLVNDRKFQYDTANVSVGYFTQKAYLPPWKKDHPELKEVYSQVLQDVAHRVHLAFGAFFDRVKKGEKPGFPRVKGEGQYESITYTQGKNFKVGGSTIEFPKLGRVKANSTAGRGAKSRTVPSAASMVSGSPASVRRSRQNTFRRPMRPSALT